jgi:hypothetical protein
LGVELDPASELLDRRFFLRLLGRNGVLAGCGESSRAGPVSRGCGFADFVGGASSPRCSNVQFLTARARCAFAKADAGT